LKHSKYENFTKIYLNKLWGDGSIDSPLSGIGSTQENSFKFFEYIANFIESYKIHTVLEIGHGDFEIMSRLDFSKLKYVGIDVVPIINEYCKIKFGSNKHLEFLLLDYEVDDLPYADLLVCKDVLIHLPNLSIINLLVKAKKYKYIILVYDIRVFQFWEIIKNVINYVTNILRLKFDLKGYGYFWGNTNQDIKFGEWRCLDIESEPFSDVMLNFKILHTFKFKGGGIKGTRKKLVLLSPIAHFSCAPEGI
jgi:hypothetical protein